MGPRCPKQNPIVLSEALYAEGDVRPWRQSGNWRHTPQDDDLKTQICRICATASFIIAVRSHQISCFQRIAWHSRVAGCRGTLAPKNSKFRCGAGWLERSPLRPQGPTLVCRSNAPGLQKVSSNVQKYPFQNRLIMAKIEDSSATSTICLRLSGVACRLVWLGNVGEFVTLRIPVMQQGADSYISSLRLSGVSCRLVWRFQSWFQVAYIWFCSKAVKLCVFWRCSTSR